MSSKTTFNKSNATVCISIEEFEYLMKCQKELGEIKTLIGELLGGK